MSRLFDGVDDFYGYTIPAGVALNDALSLLIVCRIVTTTDNTWLSLLEGKRSTGAVGCALGRNNSGLIYFANTSSTIAAGSITDSDGWMIVAVTRTAAAASSAHKAPIGGSRTTNALGALADGLSLASGTMRIGGQEDFANIRVAAAAAWQSDIGTAGIDAVLSALTTQSIADLSPFWLVDDSDAFATNLVDPGVMDRSSTGGAPADDADDPAGWVYGLGGGGTDATVTSPVLDAAGDVATPAVTASSNPTSPVLDATADIPAPTVTGQINATVTSPPLAATGDLVAPASVLSVEVTAGPLSALGDLPAPTASGSAARTSPALQATGDLTAPAATGSSSATAPVLDATGNLPTPAVTGSGDSTVIAPTLDATGDLPVAAFSATTEQTAPALTALGDLPAPALSWTALLTSPALEALGDLPAPTINTERAWTYATGEDWTYDRDPALDWTYEPITG